MNKDQPSPIRFDHREIAVIFSLFIFVSLLMFTVGIVVGKGLAQARFDGMAANLTQHPPPTPPAELQTAKSAPVPQPAVAPATTDRAPAEVAAAEPPTPAPLKLIPKTASRPAPLDVNIVKEAEALTHNPKIRPLLEGYAPPKAVVKAPPPEPKKEEPRKTASAPVVAPAPPSFGSGPFTVQVGSYPTKTDAIERINSLKAMGFPHAYLSVKKFGDGKEIWYRVWLGYYPDMETAKKSGEYLQQRGEVNNYLIRKSDNLG
jgi:hypothetical protein